MAGKNQTALAVCAQTKVIFPFKCNSIPQWVLSLQQDLKAGNTFVDAAVKRPIKQKQSIKQNSKARRRQNLSSEPDQMLGKRKRKSPERLEL